MVRPRLHLACEPRPWLRLFLVGRLGIFIGRVLQRLRFHPFDSLRGIDRVSLAILFEVSTAGRPKPVIGRSIRSIRPPISRPAATSLVQCASRTIRVSTSAAPVDQTAALCFGGSKLAAEANAPIWTAWPDGKESSRRPESGTPCQCPRTVRR